MYKHEKLSEYIGKHPIATLGTIDDDGRPYGTVVYIVGAVHEQKLSIYFMTKSETAKYGHMKQRPEVSITVYDEHELSTMQTQGKAFTETNPDIIDDVMKKLTRVHARMREWMPPLAKLRAGHYVVMGVDIAQARLSEFHNAPIGGVAFTETHG